jgi:hypothetical protein
MARAYSIPLPFPADLDRNAFANYISGFTDGEGHFGLTLQTRTKRQTFQIPSAVFLIGLRADDLPVLQLFHSFFGCGCIDFKSNARWRNKSNARTHDVFIYRAQRTKDLVSTIIPHFERFPLRAKKAKDFLIWKQGVLLLHQVIQLPRRRLFGRRGMDRRWTGPQLNHFASLVEALKDVRQFNAPIPEAPPSLPPPDSSLFDGLD